MENDDSVIWKVISYFPKYSISSTGLVGLTNTGNKILVRHHPSSPRPSVRLRQKTPTDGERAVIKRVVDLIIEHHLPKPQGDETVYYTLIYKDGNKNNPSVVNLFWKPVYTGVIPLNQRDQFKDLPFDLFTCEYAISKEGVVINKNTWKPLAFGIDKDGYRTYGVRRKTYSAGSISIGQHRLLALAYLDCPGDPKNFQVNHKDGNKQNNSLENLEWVSAAENVRHAYETGLCLANMFIVARHVVTHTLTKFKSLKDASRYLSSNPDRVGNAVTTKQTIRDHRVAEVDRSTQTVTWDDGSTTNTTLLPLKLFTNTVVSRNIITNKIEIWNNSNQVSKILRIDHSVVESRASMQTPWPVRNYCFLWGDAYKNGAQFRDFTPEELRCFKDQVGIKNPVKVTNENGDVKIFRSAEYAAKALSSTAALVGKAIHGKTKINECFVRYLK